MKQNTQTNNLFLRITGLFVILLVIASVTGLTLPRVFTAQAVTPPNIISYQGRILNSNSVPVADATATMIFELYDASAGGTCLWSNSSATCATATGKVITLTDGLFSENLGDTGDSYAAIADSVFADNGGVYLQVTIGGETLTPRKQISAAPYALNADTVDGIDSTGLMLSTGDTATGSFDFTGAELLGASPFQFEGTTDDNVYTTFAFTDPTVARTITFKDESGTVALLSDVGGTSLFTDGGTTSYLTATTDDLAIGGTAPASSPFGVDESANTVYIGEGSTANGNIVFKASDADTGTLTYNTSDQFAFTGGNISSDGTITASDFSCTDCLNFTELANALSLDSATTVTGSAGESLQLLRTLTNATTEYAMLISVTASDTTSSTEDQRGLVIQNGNSTESLDEAIWIYNADTDDAIANGITIESTTGGITTGVNLSDTDIVTALDLNSNPILYDGIRVAELSTGTLTWEDTSGNDLMTLTDGGTTGTLAVTGDLTCTDCFDFSDFADSMTLDVSTSIDGANSLALTVLSDLSSGARSTDLFVISQANDVTNDSTGDLFQITQSDTASTGKAFYIQNDGAGTGIHIEQDGDTGALVPSLTSTAALHVNNTANDGMGLSLYSNNGATVSGPLAYFLVNNAAFDREVLFIENDGVGDAITVRNDGAGAGINIDQNGVTDDIIPAGGVEAGLAIDNNGNTGMGLSVYTNVGASLAPLAYLLSDNTAFDEEVLYVQQDGSAAGVYIDNNGTGRALDVRNASTDYGMLISQSANGTAQYISSLSTTADVLAIVANNITSGDALYISGGGASTTGNLLNLASGGGAGDAVSITNAGTGAGVFIDQTGDTTDLTPGSTTEAALHITNTTNDGMGFSIYSDNGATANAPLAYIFSDNTAFDEEVLRVQNDGTGAGLFLNQNGNGRAFYADSQSTTASVVDSVGRLLTSGNLIKATIDSPDLSSGDLFFGTTSGTHTSAGTVTGNLIDVSRTNVNNSGGILGLFGALVNIRNAPTNTSGTLTDSQDLIFLDQNNTGATGAALNIDAEATGAVAINVDSEATTANVATFDGSVLTTGNILELIGGNFTDDSGMALSIDVTESTETADILNIQTNFSTSNNNVFRIEADGEAFSDIGFTAGAFSTNYYDASITSTGAFTYASPTSFTWTDDAANTLMTLTDSGTTGTLDVTGDLTCTDCFDYTDWVDGTSSLDATTSTQLGTNNYNFLVNDTGDVNVVLQSSGGIFTVRDGAIEYLTFNNAQEVDYIGDGTTGDAWDFASSTLTTGSMFDIDATNASMGGDVITILNAGTGSSIFIDADGNTGAGVNNAALTVDNSGNTDYGLTVISTNTTTAYPLVRFVMDSGSADEEALYVQNDGTASGVYVDQNGNTGATVTNAALAVENSGNTGFGLTVYSSQATSSESLVQFEATANFDDDVLTITNAATNAASSALYIDATGAAGSGAAAIDIDANVGAFALDIFNDGNSTTRDGIRIQAGLDTNPGSADDYILFVDGDGTTLGAVEGDGAGGVTTASAGSDYAELFPGNYAAFSTGDVVALDSAGNSVLASSSRQLIGAYSVAPNTLGNWFDEWQVAGTHVPVALLGQVPVNVNMEGGPIAVGDHLAISSVNGVATKATGVGYVLGTALESTSANGQIMVFVQPKWHALDIFVDNGDTTLVSEGLVLGQTATATAGNTGESSNALSLKGSAWTGASAVGREMFVQNDVTDGDNYKLSVKNDDGAEVAFINNEGDLSLSGKLYPSDRGIAQTDKYIFYDGSTGFGGDFMRTNASGWGSGSYDFAEMFPSRDSLVAGELVVFAEGSAEVARSTSRHYDPKIAGIISTQPGFLAGDNIEGHVPVALTGRVPTYVTTENGAIQSGDPITTSSRPGYAMKATTEGQIVGYAMEGFSGNTGVITVFVRPSYYDGSTITDAPAADNTVSGLQGSISDFDVTGVLNMNGGSIINVASLSGISGIWELRHDGEFRTKGRFVHLIASSQGELVETYPTLSRQTTIELTGTAQLTNGRARIIFEDIDAAFNDIISPTAPYRVFLTADSPTNPIYAIERDNDGFVIRETNGSSNATIDWMVIAYHKDFTPVDDTSIQGQDAGVTEPANEALATEEPVADSVTDPDPVVTEDLVEETIVEPVVEEPTVETVPETTAEPEVVVSEDPAPEPVVEELITEEPVAEPVPESTDETAV